MINASETTDTRAAASNEAVESILDASVNDQSVNETVFAMVDKAAPKKSSNLTGDTLLDDIGMDSLEKLSVAMDLEELYELWITDEEVEAFLTIKDVSDHIENALLLKREREGDELLADDALAVEHADNLDSEVS